MSASRLPALPLHDESVAGALRKPFSIEALVETVERAVRQRGPADDRRAV
jgi:hypothetical protein